MKTISAESMELTQKVRDSYVSLRSKAEFCTWVNQTMDEWKAFVYRCGNQKEWRGSFSSDDSRIWAKFFDEARPLSQLIATSPDFSEEFDVQLFLDSAEPDARLKFKNGLALTVEVTRPRDGHSEFWQQRCIEEFGGSFTDFSSDAVENYKSALDGGRPLKMEFFSTKEIFSKTVDELQGAVDKKCKKSSYENHQSVVLLVALYDNQPTFSALDFSEGIRVPERHPFQSIYLLGEHSMSVVDLLIEPMHRSRSSTENR